MFVELTAGFTTGFQCWDKNHFSLPIPTELDWLSGRGGHVHHWPEFCPVRPILTKYNENFHYCGREEKALKSIFYYSPHLNPSSNPCSFAVCFTVSKKKSLVIFFLWHSSRQTDYNTAFSLFVSKTLQRTLGTDDVLEAPLSFHLRDSCTAHSSSKNQDHAH